jgi:hypothetical protein
MSVRVRAGIDGFETEVDAEHAVQAVALVVAEFRNDELNTSEPALMTEFTIRVGKQSSCSR